MSMPRSPDKVHGLLESALGLIRYRADGLPAKGVPAWVRVFARCEQRGECWEFTGTPNDDGYGKVRRNGRMVGAHRIAWETASGTTAPADMDVCHTCDNPPCCNPADNNADRHVKGRTVMPTNGPDHLRAKTHCPQNHPYDGDNLRTRPNGQRRCAQCYRDRAAEYAAANRDQINARKRASRAARRSA